MHAKLIQMTLFSLSLGFAQAADLSLNIEKISEASGSVLVAVYDSADTFLKNPVVTGHAPASQGKVLVNVGNLKPGQYAVSLFQDLNQNYKLDRNPLGIPSEPYGFSNDAAGSFGPPSFEQAKFVVGDVNQTLTVNLR